MEEVNYIRDLSIYIDNKLKFDQHVAKITKSSFIRLNNIQRILPKALLIETYVKAFKPEMDRNSQRCRKSEEPEIGTGSKVGTRKSEFRSTSAIYQMTSF